MSVYVLQVRSGCEEFVCKRLKLLGLDAFLPMKKAIIRKNGIKNQLIFSQYVFLKFKPNSENYHLIRHIEGVVRFLGTGIPMATSKLEEAYLQLLRNHDESIDISRVHVLPDGTKQIFNDLK